MKCCSRSTLGVIIGIINILFYVGGSIIVIGLIQSDPFDINAENRTIHQREQLVAVSTFVLSAILSACLLMVLISGLLVMGITKRRHMLMWPWLALSGLALACNCIRIVCNVIVGFANGVPIPTLLILLFVGVLGVGLQGLILWPIYTLCKDIGEKNKQKPGQIQGGINYNNFETDAAPLYYTDKISSVTQKA